MNKGFSVQKVSVLNTLSTKWKNRSKEWKQTYNIKSELGRENSKNNTRFLTTQGSEKGPSIFDPTLCEVLYSWFTPLSGSILDPFAGGSVRGIVATEMGYSYTGIELSDKQVAQNKLQSQKPTWIVGDSDEELDTLQKDFDFVFSCPPYFDLEIYSEDPKDLSSLQWQAFSEKYSSIIKKTVSKMKDNSFACFVVTEVRERSHKGRYCEGHYRGLVPLTISAFEEAGTHFYNDIILYTSPFFPGMLSEKIYKQSCKIMSTHQNVLVFVKGNPNLATLKVLGHKGTPCNVEGVAYDSFEHASIHHKIGRKEVERRCRKASLRWKDWYLEGSKLNPTYKISIGGYLFESPKDATRFLPIKESQIRDRVDSPNPLFRHYKRLDPHVTDVTFEDNEAHLKGSNIPTELPIIKCEGVEYFTMQDAADALKLSRERVRQKLVSDRYEDFIYLYEK